MFVEVKEGDAPVIIGRDAKTGISALVFGEITFVADSDAAVRQLHEGIARWHASLAGSTEDPS